MLDTRNEFLVKVDFERDRQNDKWGAQNHAPEVWLGILMEEVGEVAKAALENDGAGYEKELIQVAAVACAMYESYARNEKARSGAHLIEALNGLEPR